MKKSLTRKLAIAVIALVFAVVSLSTSTYAWFTMSNSAQIDAFEAQVKAGEGIEIAITKDGDASEAQWFTGNVPDTEVEKLIGDVKFDAITTKTSDLGSNTFKVIDAAQKSEVAIDATAAKKYVSFFVHVRTAKAGNVYLDGITLASSNQKNWEVDKNFTKANNSQATVADSLLYDVANAARVAIKTSTNTTIYENNKDAQQVTTETNGLKVSEQNTLGLEYTTGALSYWNNKYSYTGETAENQPMAAPSKDNKYSSLEIKELDNNKLSLGTTQTEYQEISFEVVIWIEGWDAECINAIFAQTLSTQFNIKYTEQTQANPDVQG